VPALLLRNISACPTGTDAGFGVNAWLPELDTMATVTVTALVEEDELDVELVPGSCAEEALDADGDTGGLPPQLARRAPPNANASEVGRSLILSSL
jgi:hypothetical protein